MEMGDLISRKALLEKLDECEKLVRKLTANVDDKDEMIATLSVVSKFVNNQHGVDAEPVRHGRWGTYHITGYDGLHPTYTVPCSACAYEAIFTYRYCPHCGARMDGEEE